MRPCRRQTAIVDMSLRGAALSLCAVLMLSAASWPAPSLAQSVNQSGRGNGWPEDPRLRPYVIEGAPDERGVENEPRRRATARSVPREESAREERSDEAVPSPVPVARPALAGSAVRSVASATGGAACNNPNANPRFIFRACRKWWHAQWHVRDRHPRIYTRYRAPHH